MLPWMFFVFGLVLLILGIFKKTGFQDVDANERIAWFFWIYGFMHIVIAFFLFNAPAPFGSIAQVNTSMNYSPGYAEYMNDTLNCMNYSFDNTTHCEHNYNTSITGNVATSVDYTYNLHGQDIANTIVMMDFVFLTFYWLVYFTFMLKDQFFKPPKGVRLPRGGI